MITLPNAGVEINAFLLVALGFTVGVASAFFGFGGGFITTPALNMLGLTMPFAVGTDLAQIMGKSVISMLKHRRLGNVDLRLGALMIIGSVPGCELGKRVLLQLESVGLAEEVVRYVYMVLLTGMGLYMVWHTSRALRRGASAGKDLERSAIAEKVYALHIPPMVRLKQSGIQSISLWIIVALGLFVGFLAGLLGVGGGFINMPFMIYVMGVPTTVAVGTDLFAVFITGSYGSLTYAMVNRIDILVVVLMVVGSSAGAQIGTLATRYVHGSNIRLYFALTILITAVAVFMQQLAMQPGMAFLKQWAFWLLLSAATAITLLISGLLIRALAASRAKAAAQAQEAPAPSITHGVYEVIDQ